MCPLEAYVLQVNEALLFIPKRHKITFTDFFIKCSHLVEWPAQLNTSSWILSHLQETAKNTSLPSLFDPLTPALSILILFYLSVFFLFWKTHTHLTLYQLHIYSVTASCSWKTNTRFLFSIFYLLVFLKKKKTPCYVYYVRLTKTCHSTCMLLPFCWFLIASIALICKSLWTKASAKWLNK